MKIIFIKVEKKIKQSENIKLREVRFFSKKSYEAEKYTNNICELL